MKKSQITYAVWPWGTKTREQAAEAAKDVTAIGYTTFESVKAAAYAFDLDAKAYKEFLAPYGLKPVSFYFHLPTVEDPDDFFGNLDAELQFVKDMGVDIVTLQGTRGRPEGDMTNDEAKKLNLERMIRFATIAKKYGITTNVHPHVNTFFMFEDEVDYVMENSSPDVLSLAPDTAHIAAAGANPVKMIEKYADRVKFIHLKDYKLGDSVTSEGWVDSGVPIMTCFHPLGKGTVNFPAILDILDKAGYKGYLCIELDCPPDSNAESAKKNYDYLCSLVED